MTGLRNLIRRAAGWIFEGGGFANYPPDDDYWYNPRVAPTYSGVLVNESTAMTCAAVWACINYYAQTIASLPLNVFERMPSGEKRPAPEHPLQRILHDQPNANQTSMEFWEQAIAHMLTWGNAYAMEVFDSRQNVTGLNIVTPDKVKRIFIADGTDSKYFEIVGENGQPRTVSAFDLFHLPYLGYDGLKGYSPVEIHRQAIALGKASEEYGARFFGNSAIPGGYISHPMALSPKAKENLRQSINDLHGGLRGSHRLGILEEGMKWETVPVNHRDIQFLELRKYQVEEIARIYRVPLHKIQNLDRSTNNNIEHQAIEAVTDCIRPMCVRIERRINSDLFGPFERNRYFAEFNLEGLLRGDAASRATFYSTLFNIGAMTPNEIRAKENLNPHPNPAADELHVQGAIVPLGTQPKQIEAPAGTSAQADREVTVLEELFR